jgi:hypothetical protein
MEEQIKLVTVEGREWTSSLIKHTEYNPDDEQLFIVFQNEAQYVYLGIDKKTYEEFCNAESVGSYFGKNLRGKYDYAKIVEGEVSEFVKANETTKDDNQEGA